MFVLNLLHQLTSENITETDNSIIILIIYNILVELLSCREEFEDTKRVNRIRKSKDRHNGQKKINKMRDNDLQNITHITKDPVTQKNIIETDNSIMISILTLNNI